MDPVDNIDEDEEFERMSDDDLGKDIPCLTKDKIETVDKEGNRWTTLYFNDNDWESHKKFERWIVTDGMRPELVVQAKENIAPKLIISMRLEHVMDSILANLAIMRDRALPLRKKKKKQAIPSEHRQVEYEFGD